MPKEACYPMSGSCLCGGVAVTATGPPMLTAHCCCRDCQRVTGSGHSTLVIFPEEAIAIAGEVGEYASPSDAGSTVTRLFCPICGSRIGSRNTGFPGRIGMHAGVFDDPGAFEPSFVCYASRKQAWDEIAKDLPAFDAMPPRRERGAQAERG